MRLLGRLAPVELGLLEGRGQCRVRDVLAGSHLPEFWEMNEFPASSLAHRVGKAWFEIAEAYEGSCPTPFLPQKQQRDLRRQQHDRNPGMQRRAGRPRRQPGSKRLVADGIVVLQKRDKSGRGQRRRGVATRSAAAK